MLQVSADGFQLSANGRHHADSKLLWDHPGQDIPLKSRCVNYLVRRDPEVQVLGCAIFPHNGSHPLTAMRP